MLECSICHNDYTPTKHSKIPTCSTDCTALHIANTLRLRAIQIRKEKALEYDKNPNHCKQCQQPLPYGKRKNKYCDHSCSSTYINTGSNQSVETKTSISNSLRKANKNKQIINPEYSRSDYYNIAAFYIPDDILDRIPGYQLISQYGTFDSVKNKKGASRDHMFSISDGWKYNIPPEIIGHPANCEIMLMPDNRKKGMKSSITKEELYERIETWRTQRDSNPQPKE